MVTPPMLHYCAGLTPLCGSAGTLTHIYTQTREDEHTAAHLHPVQDGRKLSVHLTHGQIPQKVDPLVAEVHVLIGCQINSADMGVGGEETCLAALGRAINILHQGQGFDESPPEVT